MYENMNNKLLIIGAGGHGRVVADIALKMNKWKYVAFIDENENVKSSMGIEVIGNLDKAYEQMKDCDIFVAVGNNAIRKKMQESFEAMGANIPILIHPSAIIGKDVNIASGTVVMAGVVINSCTNIGKGCIINTGSTLDHDNLIEDYVHISPGVNLAGMVKIGECSWLGIGSVVSNYINITGGCKVGAGAVVVKDLVETGTYVGVPARRVKYESTFVS